MSAGILRKCQTGTSPTYVQPLPVSEKSALASVVEFVTDVVPQTTSAHTDDKDKVLWVKLEQLTLSVGTERLDDQIPPSILIIIGYTNGVQVWQMLPSGKAKEMISLRQGPLKVYTVIQRTKSSHSPPISDYLIASTDESAHSLTPFSTVKLSSLLTGEEVWKHSFKNTVNEVLHNSKLLLVTFYLKIAAFDLFNFKPLFTVSGCFPAEGPNCNPISLGSSWLAYADSKLVTSLKSHGDCDSGAALSYTATVLNTAKTVAKGVSTIGESLMNNFSGGYRPRRGSGSSSPSLSQTPGVITVLDCDQLKDHFTLDSHCSGPEVVSHFQALAQPVAVVKFDCSGTLLFCACSEGQNFHVYHLIADMYGSGQAGVQHLYVLHRGDTTAQVLDVTFTIDSRWVAVCTARGTTHLFPISPYGGKATARTHVSQYVVNKATKYEKSSGLEEVVDSAVAEKLSSPGLIDTIHSSYLKYNNGAMENPVLKSYTSPCVIEPLHQIKPVEWCTQYVTRRHIPNKNIAACFTISTEKKRKQSFGLKALQATETLYIMGDHGDLIQYTLQPSPDCDYDEITDNSTLNLSVTTKSRWPLGRTYTQKERRHYSPEARSDKSCAHHGSRESISSDTGSCKSLDDDDEWLAQVEMVTCSGPNRRLWMGPQFKFKTYNTSSVVVCSESPALFPSLTPGGIGDTLCDSPDLDSLQFNNRPTLPITMPLSPKRRLPSDGSWKQRASSVEDVFIEAGSFEPSPRMAVTAPIFEPFEGGEQYFSVESFTNHLLADAMEDQNSCAEDLMMFPPGS